MHEKAERIYYKIIEPLVAKVESTAGANAGASKRT